MRKKKKHSKKIVMEKLTTLADTSSINGYFWRRLGHKARFAATWKAIDEFYKIRGISGYKPRLQRSVQNIKQA